MLVKVLFAKGNTFMQNYMKSAGETFERKMCVNAIEPDTQLPQPNLMQSAHYGLHLHHMKYITGNQSILDRYHSLEIHLIRTLVLLLRAFWIGTTLEIHLIRNICYVSDISYL